MDTTEKAHAIYIRYLKMKETVGATDDYAVTVMVHNVPELHTLDRDWKKDTLESGDYVRITAKREGVTLFSSEKLRIR